MEPHSKIVEFYGLPGCGKTTLTNYLIESEYNIDSQKFGRINILFDNFKNLSFLKKVSVLPFKAWYYSFRFILTVPRIPVRKWKLYRSFFYIPLVYSMKSINLVPSYILVDHGIFQSAQSLIYGRADTLSDRSWRLLLKIATLIKIDFAIYCDIPTSVSLERIRKRNRKGNGRLDMLEDDSYLIQILEKQAHLFKREKVLSEQMIDTVVVELNTDASVPEVVKALTFKLY